MGAAWPELAEKWLSHGNLGVEPEPAIEHDIVAQTPLNIEVPLLVVDWPEGLRPSSAETRSDTG